MRAAFCRYGLGLLAMCGGLAACVTQPVTQQPKFGEAERMRVAQAAEQSGDYSLADSMYASASADAPADAAAQLRYADVLARRGNITQARDLLLRHLDTVSDVTALRHGLGAVYLLMGDSAHAITEFDQVLAAHPNDMRAVVDKAVALDLQGRHADAQTLYRRALAASPGDAVVISDLALSMMLDGRASEATALVAPLKDAGNLPPRVRTNIAIVLAAGGDVDASREVVQDAAAEGEVMRLARAVPQGADAGTDAKP